MRACLIECAVARLLMRGRPPLSVLLLLMLWLLCSVVGIVVADAAGVAVVAVAGVGGVVVAGVVVAVDGLVLLLLL